MRYLFIFFWASISFVSAQQVKNGSIAYRISMERFYDRAKTNDETKDNPSLFLYKQAVSEVDKMSAILTFRGEKAIFKNEKSLALGEKSMGFTLASILGNKGVFYTDMGSKVQYVERELQGISRTVKKTIKEGAWKFTNMKKRIADFNCLKAERILQINEREFLIEAWYCPEVPVSLGPADCVGQLPGLVLEYHNSMLSYYADNIKINNNPEIKWPKRFKTISEEEYKKQSKMVRKQVGPGNR